MPAMKAIEISDSESDFPMEFLHPLDNLDNIHHVILTQTSCSYVDRGKPSHQHFRSSSQLCMNTL